MVKNTVYHFLVLTCGFRYFWKWGIIKKRVHWNRRLRLLCTLWIGVSWKIPFTLDTYVLTAKMLQNGAKFRYTKVGFKNYRKLNNFRQAAESLKSWNLMGLCPKKYIPSAKTLYTVDLYNITFQLLVYRFTKLLMSFLKP